MVYDAIGGLTVEGLLEVSPKGKYRVYGAASKNSKKFLELSNEFDERSCTYCSRCGSDADRPIITYLEGKQGISAVYDDIAETLNRGDVYRYSSER